MKASENVVENNSIFEEITAWTSVREAFETLDLPVGADTTMIQINYHDQVLALEVDLADAREFASLRVAYEVAIKYNNNNKIVDNIQQIIDVSYLIEGITILALLQELVTRYEIACMKEDDFWFEYYSKEANEDEWDENCKEDIEEEWDENLEEDIDEDDVEIPDFGYPDKDEARKLLTKLEELNFNSKDGSYSGILAEAYYHVLTEGLLHDKLKSLTWYQDRYNLVKKAIETDNSEIKNVDYLLLAGKTLSKSENKDSLKKAIEYLLEIEKRIQKTSREKDYYLHLSRAYYELDDYKNAFKYARKLKRISETLDINTLAMLGRSAYSQLEESCNRMYADEAANAFFTAFNNNLYNYNYKESWVMEMLCNVCTRTRRWGLMEKLCRIGTMKIDNKSEKTLFHPFPYNYYLGVALMNMNREKEAIEHFNNALEIAGSQDVKSIYANLSRCYENINYDKAYEYMKEFQAFSYNDINYPKKCMMHFYIRKKRYEEAKRCVETFTGYKEINKLIQFRIELCEADNDEDRAGIIENIRNYMPCIQESEMRSEKNGYHVKRGGHWTEKNACLIGDIYYFILGDDEMAIRYYTLCIEIVDYQLQISEKTPNSQFKNAKKKTSYAHYMLTRIYAENSKKKQMQKHADAFMDYLKEYYSEDDSKSVEEQYINAIDDFAIRGLKKNADYLYIKPSTEMGTEDSGDYNACKLARIYIAKGNIDRSEEIAVYLAKKYRKDMPAIVFALMGDLARVHGNRLSAEQMYRAAIKKNPWEAYEVIGYLNKEVTM